MKRIIAACLWLPLIAAHAQFDALRTLTPEQGQEVRRPIEAKIFSATPEERVALEQELLDVFNASGTSLEGRRLACRMLRFCASEQCVPVLAPKLTDPDLSAFVRLVLQGLESGKADAALIAALPKAERKLKPGIIGTLGQRPGSPEAIAAIVPYLKKGDQDILTAAIIALGNIGGIEAALALSRVKVDPHLQNIWGHALLRCTGAMNPEDAARIYQRFITEKNPEDLRAAALASMVRNAPNTSFELLSPYLVSESTRLRTTAAGLLPEISTAELVDGLPEMKPEIQLLVIDILAARKAAAAEDRMLRLAQASDEAVRIAAIGALAELGTDQSLELLVELAPNDNAAFRALCRSSAAGADDAILKALESAGDDAQTSRYVECLAERKSRIALPALIEIAGKDWSRSGKAAIDGMARLVAEQDFSAYVDLMMETDDKKKLQALEASIAAGAQRLPDADGCSAPLIQALNKADGETKYSLLRSLGSIGGDASRNVLVESMTSNDPAVKDAAVRGLSSWPSLDAAPQLLELAGSADDSTHQVLALRGYIRLANTLHDGPQALEMCKKAAAVTDRPAELKTVISCAAKYPLPEVLEFLTQMLDNEAVFNEAASAICDISNHWTLKKSAVTVLERIADESSDRNLAERAEKLAKEFSG
jgi:HEAT repeat protein